MVTRCPCCLRPASLLALIALVSFAPRWAGAAGSRVDTPLRVVSVAPGRHAQGVPRATTLTVTFDRGLDAASATGPALAVYGSLSGLASGAYSYSAAQRALTFTPTRPFFAGELVLVTATALLRGADGAALEPTQWQFVVGDVRRRCVAGLRDVEAGLLPVAASSAVWGDYDRDGDLDILLTGHPAPGNIGASLVYRNDGPAGFSDIGAGLVGVYSSAAAWADWDADGDLDICIAGDSAEGPTLALYRNDGPGAITGWVFTRLAAGLGGFYLGAVDWGDYDRDGDLDLLLMGYRSYTWPPAMARLYRNDGPSGVAAWAFTEIATGLPDAYDGDIAWGDYDNDGDLDILLTGSGMSAVYRNEGPAGQSAWTFTAMSFGLRNVSGSSAAWADYDVDGDLDILLAGSQGETLLSLVYRNDGPSTHGGWLFAEAGAGLGGTFDGAVAWGDYDNDGDPDALLAGWIGFMPYTRLYRNQRAAAGAPPTFVETALGLPHVYHGSLAWGDHDGDGDLDLLLTGDSYYRLISAVIRNDDCPSVALPLVRR